jgi:hypothetical protein
MKELYHNLKVVQAFAPAQYTATQTSAAIDRMGYESVLVVVSIGACAAADAANYITFTVTTGATSAAAGAVASGDYVFETDDIADLKIDDAATQAGTVMTFSLRLRTAAQRYLKIVATETLVSDIFYSVDVILGNPASMPTH